MKIRQRARWIFKDNVIFWVWLGVIVIASVGADTVGYCNGLARIDRLPYTGWILEIAGVLCAVFGISASLRAFGDGIRQRLQAHLQRLFPENVTVNLQGPAGLKITPGDVRARTRIDRSRATVEERVAQLEEDSDLLRNDLKAARRCAREELKRVQSELHATDHRQEVRINEIENQQRQAHTGDVALELCAIGWLVVGLTCSEASGLFMWVGDSLGIYSLFESFWPQVCDP